MSDPALIGGRYRLEGFLGAGGMGRVHAATDTRLGRRVAVKLLAAGRTSTRSVRRLEREAILAARVHHPNVVAIFDAGHHEGSPYLVMELVEGTTAAELLAAEGPMPADQVVDLAEQVLGGLAAMHDLDLVHRDITPANILLADGVAKLADLGIASDPDDIELALTRPGELLGTAAYLAPERVTGESATVRSDLYAVAAVVYELLSGRPPHTRANAGATALAHLLDDAAPLSDLVPDLPTDLAAVVDGALARDPGRRPADARTFAAQLRVGLGAGATSSTEAVTEADGSVPADHPAHRTTTALPLTTIDDTAPLPVLEPRRRRLGRAVLVSGAIVVGGVLAGGAAAMLLRDDADGVAAVAAADTVPAIEPTTTTVAPTTTTPPTTAPTPSTTTAPTTTVAPTTTAPPSTLPDDLDDLVELIEEDPGRWGERARVLLGKLEDRDDFDERDLERVARDVERWLDRDRIDPDLGSALLAAIDEARRDLRDDDDDD